MISTPSANLDISRIPPDAAVELYKTLPCPSMKEMTGEFRGKMLSFPTLWTRLFWGMASRNPIFPGVWQGKSFRQTGASEGRGYNTTKRFGCVRVDLFPMATRIGPSYFDGKPSFQLIYRAYRSYCGDIHMIDEVRRLDDGRYLGIGRCGRTVKQRRLPMPFLLEGPSGSYRKDTGTQRGQFNLNNELGLLEFPQPIAS